MSRTYGWRPDPRTTIDAQGNNIDLLARDFDVKSLLAVKPQLTAGDVDLRPYCTETNQLQLSACAGNASADAVEIETAIEESVKAVAEGRPPNQTPQLARLFVYSMSRTLDGTLDKDEGTYIRSCFQTLASFGICLETDWPYDPTQVFVSPSMIAQRKATGHKIHSFYRIKTDGQDRLNDIIAALRSYHPVVFGTLIEQSFENNNGPLTIGPPTGATVGGHAMIIVGYVGGLFIVKNSWGKDWRGGGFCFMQPDYLTWNETQDLWVPTLGYS